MSDSLEDIFETEAMHEAMHSADKFPEGLLHAVGRDRRALARLAEYGRELTAAQSPAGNLVRLILEHSNSREYLVSNLTAIVAVLTDTQGGTSIE